MLRYFKIGLTFATFQVNAQVQDVSFSQYFNFPALLNPTFAGSTSANYRVAGIYRQQWKAIEADFETYGVAGDIAIRKNPLGKGTFGVGFYAIDDHLGNNIIKQQKAGVSLAYHRPLDFQERHRISIGINGTYNNNSINYDLLNFESQYVGFVLNPDLPTGETFTTDQIENLNIGVGLSYRFRINKKEELMTNFSLLEIMAPKEYFLSNASSTVLTNRWTGAVSWRHRMNTRVALVPSVQFISFQNTTDFRFGTISEFRGFKNVDLQLEAGAFYQLQNALTLYAGVNYRNYSVHFSYDFTVSSLNGVTDSTDQNFKKPGTLEISFVMKGLPKSGGNKYATPCRFF